MNQKLLALPHHAGQMPFVKNVTELARVLASPNTKGILMLNADLSVS